MATRLTAAEGWQGPRRPYLLVEGDVVQPHAHLPGEEVGAAETVLQEAPAQPGARRRVEGVPGATQAQGGAGLAQTLGAGVVVVEETWGRDPGRSLHPRTWAPPHPQLRGTPGGPAHLAQSWTRCQSLRGPAHSTSRSSTWKHAPARISLQSTAAVARAPPVAQGWPWLLPGRGRDSWSLSPAWPHRPPPRQEEVQVHRRRAATWLGAPPAPPPARALPTDVSPGQEGDHVLPLKHLLLVLEVGEVSRGAAHQLKACVQHRRAAGGCPVPTRCPGSAHPAP